MKSKALALIYINRQHLSYINGTQNTNQLKELELYLTTMFEHDPNGLQVLVLKFNLNAIVPKYK